MSKGKLKHIEAFYGKSIDLILVDLYLAFGSQKLVADELNVAQSTVSEWLLRFGLRHYTVLADKDGNLCLNS